MRTGAPAWWAIAAAVTAGCLTSARAVALYPGDPRPPAQVATLQGPIATVDGQDVSARGDRFALLPSCHVVTLQRSLGESNSAGTAAWAANLPEITYAFAMRAGYKYLIDYALEEGSRPSGRLLIRAREEDPTGGTTTVAQATSPADIEDCRRQAARKK